MKSFLVLLFMSTFLGAVSVHAEGGKEDLFSIQLTKTDKQSFKQLLTHAIKIELVRLTGTAEILNNPDAKPFIEHPKTWLKSFNYAPVYSEGVAIGQKIVFKFDQDRIYQQFQAKHLLVWPLSRRPKILVMGQYFLGASLTKVTQSLLNERPNINFLRVAKNVSLPLSVPRNSAEWVNPNKESGRLLLAEMMAAGHYDYVLDLKTQRNMDGRVTVSWRLLDQHFMPVATHKIQGFGSAMRYYEKMINDIMRITSATYRQNATVLGKVTLKVVGVESYQKLKALESLLNHQKPNFRQVKLLEVRQDIAMFEIEYQGKLEFAIDLLQRSADLVVIENNTLIGQLTAEWQ